MVEHLLDSPYSRVKTEEDYAETLEYACICDRLPIVKYLFQRMPVLQNGNNMALDCAASSDAIEVVQYLLEIGFDVNAVDDRESNAIRWAAQENYVELAQILLEHGCEINYINLEDESPLYVAAAEGNIEIAKLFLKHGAKVDLSGKASPFAIACLYRRFDVAELLYQNGADVNYPDLDGRTALFYATVKQSQETIDYLRAHGARDDIRDTEGIYIYDLSKEKLRKKLYRELF